MTLAAFTDLIAATSPLTVDDTGTVLDAWTSPTPLVLRRPRPCMIAVTRGARSTLGVVAAPGAQNRAVKANNHRKLWGYR